MILLLLAGVIIFTNFEFLISKYLLAPNNLNKAYTYEFISILLLIRQLIMSVQFKNFL